MVVGGVIPFYNLFPFLVDILAITNDKEYGRICGGSLVRYDWVITAAHCVQQHPERKKKYAVGAGRTLTNFRILRTGAVKFVKGQTRRAWRIYTYERYCSVLHHNDIALIQLKVPFRASSEISLVPLPKESTNEDLSKHFKYCYTAGWGVIGDNIVRYYDEVAHKWKFKNEINSTNSLVHVVLPIISNKECRRIYHEQMRVIFDVVDTEICTFYYPGRKAACRGDSGGPLMCGSVQHGIVSWSFSCGQPRLGVDVYTRLDKYLNWINTTISANRLTNAPFTFKKLDYNYYADIDDAFIIKSCQIQFLFIIVLLIIFTA